MMIQTDGRDIRLQDRKEADEFFGALKKENYNNIAGVDEVGRGPLFGPVVAACVILPDNHGIKGITDSKKISKKIRERISEEITEKAVAYSIGVVDSEIIDLINIRQASLMAAKKAIEGVNTKVDYIISDAGLHMSQFFSTPTSSFIKGDYFFECVGAASIVAKVYRDQILQVLDGLYPEYDLGNNSGYGSSNHIKAIKEFGITPLHRKSFGICNTAKIRG